MSEQPNVLQTTLEVRDPSKGHQDCKDLEMIDLSTDDRRRRRNRDRMREHRKNPDYKEKERRRQAELRSIRKAKAKGPSGSGRLSGHQPTVGIVYPQWPGGPTAQQYPMFPIPQIQQTGVSFCTPQNQFSSTEASYSTPQVCPVELPCLEAEKMPETTCIVALPTVSSSPIVPAVAQMAVVPPVPTIITLVIVPSEAPMNGEIKAQNTVTAEPAMTANGARFSPNNLMGSRQILNIGDSSVFWSSHSDLASGKKKPVEVPEVMAVASVPSNTSSFQQEQETPAEP